MSVSACGCVHMCLSLYACVCMNVHICVLVRTCVFVYGVCEIVCAHTHLKDSPFMKKL